VGKNILIFSDGTGQAGSSPTKAAGATFTSSIVQRGSFLIRASIPPSKLRSMMQASVAPQLPAVYLRRYGGASTISSVRQPDLA